jgi:hypothetical protein
VAAGETATLDAAAAESGARAAVVAGSTLFAVAGADKIRTSAIADELASWRTAAREENETDIRLSPILSSRDARFKSAGGHSALEVSCNPPQCLSLYVRRVCYI